MSRLTSSQTGCIASETQYCKGFQRKWHSLFTQKIFLEWFFLIKKLNKRLCTISAQTQAGIEIQRIYHPICAGFFLQIFPNVGSNRFHTRFCFQHKIGL